MLGWEVSLSLGSKSLLGKVLPLLFDLLEIDSTESGPPDSFPPHVEAQVVYSRSR